MVRLDRLLARMRRNPRGDWRMEQLKAVADHHGIPYRQPGTSHVIFAPASRNVSYRFLRTGRSSPSTFASS
jgi:hypothetical protein